MPPELPHACALLKVLLSKHRHGGSPLPRDAVVNMAAVPSHGIGEAKDTFETLRTSSDFPFVESHGPERALLNNSKFPELVDYLYDVCGWSEFKIDDMTRHYDVLENHTFD